MELTNWPNRSIWPTYTIIFVNVALIFSILFSLDLRFALYLSFKNQDGRIDYNEFVAMMQKGNANLGKKGLLSSFSIGFREALSVC